MKDARRAFLVEAAAEPLESGLAFLRHAQFRMRDDYVEKIRRALAVLGEEIVHDLPGKEWRRIQRATGYRYVLINGEVTIENDQQTNRYPGQLLRHGTGKRQPQLQAAE